MSTSSYPGVAHSECKTVGCTKRPILSKIIFNIMRQSPAKKPAKTPAKKAARVIRDLHLPEYFFNRELSWLEFNQRVLEEAQDPTNPLLERLKFLTIVSSNLDEFFEIRVAGLQQQAETSPQRHDADGMTAGRVLSAISERVSRLVEDQYRCYSRDLVPGLAREGIFLSTVADLDAPGKAWAEQYFLNEVFPVLTPLAIDPAHPFPQLLNKSLNLAVVLKVPDTPGAIDGMQRDENHQALRFGVVQVPRVLPRLVIPPPAVCPDGRKTYLFLSSIISEHIGRLFPGLQVCGCYAFRVTRNGELYLDEDEADNLLEAMREQLQRRKRGDAVRLEVQKGCDPTVVQMLLSRLELEEVDLYEADGPVNLPRLMAIYAAEARADLKDASFIPALPHLLRHIETPDAMFAAIKHEDILLSHPYESFKSVIDFIRIAAEDPHVLAIKQTLYRTSPDSPIIRALMRAAENGKQVTVLVELKARFDEENNIQWARAMEESGVHVLYGLVGLKTHSKLALVVRREGEVICRYVHLGTGNYNEVTARLYTDIGMLTARPAIGDDAAKIFNLLTGMSQFPGLEQLHMAPFGLHTDFLALIDREARHAARKTNKTKPRIIAKMNALVDPEIIVALYRASQAGVQIDLIVRGVCCLRPGIKGVSDNIKVRSVVDRFLEHSRIFYFSNNGKEEIYCGSADWMPRNFFQRVEVVFPVLDPILLARLRDEVLGTALLDNVKARVIRSDGTHVRVNRAFGAALIRSQQCLIELAERAGIEAAHADAPADGPALRPILASHGPPGARLAVPGPTFATDGRAGTSSDPVLQVMASQQNSLPGIAGHEYELAGEVPEAVESDAVALEPIAEMPQTTIPARHSKAKPSAKPRLKKAQPKRKRTPSTNK